jgi:hypothetical protein
MLSKEQLMALIGASLRVVLAVVLVFVQLTGTLHSQTPLASEGFPPQESIAPVSIDAEQAIRISKLYATGNSAGAAYPQDYVELFNNSNQSISLSCCSLQYRAPLGATGSRWMVATLGATQIAGYGYLLIGLRQSELQAPVDPEVNGSIDLGEDGGKVAIVNGISPITAITDVAVIDAVGYGNANAWEGSAAVPALSLTTAALRKNGGCTDTDDNAADFEVVTNVIPRNSESTANVCEPPLAAELNSFTARATGDRVELTWETVSEQDIAGFNLHRGASPEGPWEQINTDMIAAAAPGAGGGATYRYDEPGPGLGTWWYRLGAVDLGGHFDSLGLTQVDIADPTAVGLTELRARTTRAPVAAAMLIGALWLLALTVGYSARKRT